METLVIGDGFAYRYDEYPYARQVNIYETAPGPFGQYGTGAQVATVNRAPGESVEEALARYEVEAGYRD